MKKLLYGLFCTAVFIALSACGESSTKASNDDDVTTSSSVSTKKSSSSSKTSTTTKKSSASKVSSAKESKTSSSSSTKTSSTSKSSSSIKSSSSTKATSSSSSIKNTPSSSSVKAKSSSSSIASKNSSSSIEVCSKIGDRERVCCGSPTKYLNPNSTYGEMKDDRDGKTYKTVKIGNQVWMAENLNYEGDTNYCLYDRKEYCELYGRMYMYGVAMDSAGKYSKNGVGCGHKWSCYEEFNDETFEMDTICPCKPIYPLRGVCPKGWHLPSDNEWKTLFKTVGNTPNEVAKKLSNPYCWSKEYKENNGDDTFGFSVLPGGFRTALWEYGVEGEDLFYEELSGVHYWTSTPPQEEFMSYFGNTVFINPYPMDRDSLFSSEQAFSANYVRCVKD